MLRIVGDLVVSASTETAHPDRTVARSVHRTRGTDCPTTVESMGVDKSSLRRGLLNARRALPGDERAAASTRIEHHLLATPELARARTVAGYAGVGSEPHTLPLLTKLRERGVRVLLPVLGPDFELDWAQFSGAATLVRAARGLLEPDGPRLGPEAVRSAEVLLCPGLAAGRDGMRLGRGGGSFDRVLSRLDDHGADDAGTWACVLLFDGELLHGVPVEEHDRPVHAAATPAGITRF